MDSRNPTAYTPGVFSLADHMSRITAPRQSRRGITVLGLVLLILVVVVAAFLLGRYVAV